jgi:TIR domain
VSDIVVSYASEDRDRILPLVQALEATGWTIFWDRTILAGTTWRQIIDAEIKACRSVLVVWTHKSVNSEWVIEEAEIGKQKNVLVPVLLDEVAPPLGFRAIQAANLVGWNGNNSAPSFASLIAAIEKILGRAVVMPPPQPQPPGPPQPTVQIAQMFLDAFIFLMTKSAALFRRIVGTILAWFIIFETIIIVDASTRRDPFSNNELLVIGLIVLVIVLAISTLLSRLKRRRKNEIN